MSAKSGTLRQIFPTDCYGPHKLALSVRMVLRKMMAVGLRLPNCQ